MKRRRSVVQSDVVKVEFSGAYAELLKHLAKVSFFGGCDGDRHLTAGRFAFELVERELMRICIFSYGVPFGVLATRIAKGERINFSELAEKKRAARIPLTREDCEARATLIEHSGHRVKPKPSMAQLEGEDTFAESMQ